MIKSNVDISNLFTIPLLQVNILEDTSELNDNTDFIPNKNQKNTNPPFEYYRALEKYPNTKNILLKNIRSGLKTLGYVTEFDLSTSWFTKIDKGDSAPIHNHKNCWFSAVYYYGDYDKDCGKFFMNNHLRKLTSFSHKIVDVNNFNTAKFVVGIPVPKGSLKSNKPSSAHVVTVHVPPDKPTPS